VGTTAPAGTVAAPTVPFSPAGGQSPAAPPATNAPTGTLPETGNESGGVAAVALQVLLGGLVLVLLARRRPRARSRT
jgi:LPXTG-motif cell wall-anchored protein